MGLYFLMLFYSCVLDIDMCNASPHCTVLTTTKPQRSVRWTRSLWGQGPQRAWELDWEQKVWPVRSEHWVLALTSASLEIRLIDLPGCFGVSLLSLPRTSQGLGQKEGTQLDIMQAVHWLPLLWLSSFLPSRLTYRAVVNGGLLIKNALKR